MADQEARSDGQLRRYIRTPGFGLLGAPSDMWTQLEEARAVLSAERPPPTNRTSFTDFAPPSGKQLGTAMATLRGGHAGRRDDRELVQRRVHATICSRGHFSNRDHAYAMCILQQRS